MRVLIACEFSGIVRDAFRERGHDAWSCDLLPCERGGPHYQEDVMYVRDEGWDLMIAHPPCTYLASSGARWWKGRQDEQGAAINFVLRLANTRYISRIAIENPIGRLSTRWRKPDQIIQPWMFGHEETKSTCLWLKGLPQLVPTQVMEVRNRNLTPSGQNKLGPSPDRWKLRSRTYEGIARAMACQWGDL
jgi:hypothetical protein